MLAGWFRSKVWRRTTLRPHKQDAKSLVNKVSQFLTPTRRAARLDHYAARLAHRCAIGADPNKRLSIEHHQTHT